MTPTQTSTAVPESADQAVRPCARGRRPVPARRPSPAPAQRPPEARIVATLHERGKLTPGDLARARRLADDGGEPLLRMVVRLGLVSERDMAQASSEVMGLPLADPAEFPAEPVGEGLFTLRFLKDARVLPLAEDDEHLRVAVADAADPYVLAGGDDGRRQAGGGGRCPGLRDRARPRPAL